MKSFLQFSEAFAIPNYSLESKYQHFNHLLFNGELPTIPISWVASIRNGLVSGRVIATSKTLGFSVEPGSIRMEISALFKSDEERLDGILVHEMIHVYIMAIKNDGRENHGPIFRNKLSELQAKVSFKIPLTDDTKELELSDTVKNSYIAVILRKDPNQEIWGAFVGKTDWQRHGQRLMIGYLKRNTPETTYSFHFGKTTIHRKYITSKGDKYGMTRVPFVKLSPNDVESLETLPQVHPSSSI